MHDFSINSTERSCKNNLGFFLVFFYSLGYIRNGNLLFISIFISGFKLGRCHLFSLGQLYNRGMYIQIFIEAFRTFFLLISVCYQSKNSAAREA